MLIKNDFSKSLNTILFKVIREEIAIQKIEAYAIGGFVRDQLLNRGKEKDIDIVTIGSSIELAISVQKKLKGSKPVKIFKNYGTAMIHWNEIDIEFVGARKESYSKESRNPQIKQ